MMTHLKLFGTSLLRATVVDEKTNLRKKFRRFGYESCAKGENVQILKRKKMKSPILALLNNIAVVGNLNQSPRTVYLYPDINIKSIRFKITLNQRNFKGLIENSKIQNVMLLKYMRNVSSGIRKKAWRLVVITDKCQIFHNFPSMGNEFEGTLHQSDIVTFEESVIWDAPGRKFPSKSKNCSEFEQYFPGLPEQSYSHHPSIQKAHAFGDHTYVSVHGQKVVVSRFYFPFREADSNPFSYMGGFTNDYHMTTIGSYCNNISKGARICIFFSSDGGRQWFNKYDFGDFGNDEFISKKRGYSTRNWGNPICLPDNFSYSDPKLSVTKRNILVESYKDEQVKPFSWSAEVKIKTITQKDRLVVQTEAEHNLSTGDIVALTGDAEANETFSWMINNEIDENGCGNGILFKAEVLTQDTFALYESISSPHNPICCRHVHHINRQKDGWVVGTGEVFPNGWLLYLQQKECDYFVKEACNAAVTPDVFRLNSVPSSVQRTLGVEFIADDVLLFASDHATLPQPMIPHGDMPFSHSSSGIYVGNIADIDDITSFRCIHRSCEVAYFFKKTNNLLVFGGQLGEVSLSADLGKTWTTFYVDSMLRRPLGGANNVSVIDDYIIINQKEK